MQTSKALAELLALQGHVEEARVVLTEARDRLAAAASRGPAAGPRWIGPGRRAKPTAKERKEETQGMAELLLAWANVEESVSFLGVGGNESVFFPLFFFFANATLQETWSYCCTYYSTW